MNNVESEFYSKKHSYTPQKTCMPEIIPIRSFNLSEGFVETLPWPGSAIRQRSIRIVAPGVCDQTKPRGHRWCCEPLFQAYQKHLFHIPIIRSRKTYAQHQLMAVLLFREVLRTDYRAMVDFISLMDGRSRSNRSSIALRRRFKRS
jgi:hypothetical protein